MLQAGIVLGGSDSPWWLMVIRVSTLPETNSEFTPEKWVGKEEADPFLLG